jgi:predicted phage-related endonuclease
LVFKDGWLVDDGELEAPPHIEMQLQHQMMVSGRSFAFIGALIGGNQIKLLKREPDEKVYKAILKKTQVFWNSIEDNKPPDPDFSRDADTIRALYSQATTGKVLDARNNADIKGFAERYKDVSARIKELESEKTALKSHLIMLSGDAEKVIGDGFSIAMSIVKGGHVEYDREDYRNFKPYFKKEVKK